MGCSCCKEVAPKDYEKCNSDMERLKASKKAYHYIAPCGYDFNRGDNRMPPKKKRKKRN